MQYKTGQKREFNLSPGTGVIEGCEPLCGGW
ncbi:hypothetical protein LEMLEM_LOCUS4168 [Lemmus lemmus]